MDANVFGLVLNFLGAIFLAISASIQTKLFQSLIDNVTEPDFETKKSNNQVLKTKLHKEKKQIRILNRLGYILFVVGFALQIICLQFECFE